MNKIEQFFQTTGILTVAIGKMILSILKTPILYIPTFILVGFERYMLDYQRFVDALIICILADSVLGVWLSIKEKRFEFSKSMAIVQKIVVYFFYLLIIHYISRLDWLSTFDATIIYITKFVLTAMILTEGKSAIENGNSLFPNKVAGSIVWFFEKIEGKLEGKVDKDSNNKQNTQ